MKHTKSRYFDVKRYKKKSSSFDIFSNGSYEENTTAGGGGKKETLIEKPSVQKGLQAAAQQFVFASLTSLDGVGRDGGDGGEEEGGEDKKQIDKEQVGNKPSVEKGLKSAARNIVFASVASANDGGVVRLKGGDENTKSDKEEKEEEDLQGEEDEEDEDDFADYEEGWGTERCNGDTNNYHNDSYSGSEVTDSEEGYRGGCPRDNGDVGSNGAVSGCGSVGVDGGGVGDVELNGIVGDCGVKKTPRENAYISDVHIVMQ